MVVEEGAVVVGLVVLRSAEQMHGGPPPARLAWPSGDDVGLVPVADAPAVVEEHRKPCQIAEPPAGRPPERPYHRWPVEHLVERVIDRSHDSDDRALHLVSL